ncbi:MAG: MobA/MobL family protein [Sphingomonas sp.]
MLLADRSGLTDRPSAPVAFHAVGWLPTAMDERGWREIILEFLDDHVVANGMIADWALHALADAEGGWIKKPHMHAVITSRFWKGPRVGQPQSAWFATIKRRNAVGLARQAITDRAG